MSHEPRRVKGSALVVGGAVLILVTILVLLSLRRPIDDRIAGLQPPPRRDAGPTLSRQPEATTVTPPATLPAAPASRPTAVVSPPAVSDAGAPPVPGASDARPAVIHVMAPPAPPSDTSERGRKLHQLATARVRVSRLRRRERMLGESLARARKDGSWSAEKLAEAERDLRDLRGGVTAAEQDLERVRTAVGGDIDRDHPR